ncbi:thiol:disulfide interchange protein DsbA/DsbL [Microbulbifer hainanensis]|uniref:thiol:disulfide interchange protein DsbA/DsbL n=1 Tax=Microbulbifer hainanensis TaxID=2735675 RepID=UPI0018695B51|nr:thiol:disulfide interchange protein DsbA/DsbL [Microbulbifer hainanensis]
MRAVVAPFTLLFALLLSLTACAKDSGQFKPGMDYQVLPQAVPQQDDSKIEVTELFWYGCPHCYHFEPALEKWVASLPKDVSMQKVPAIWQPVMDVHARMYYVAEQMGVLDKMHEPIFTAIAKERKMFAVREGRDWKPDLKAIEELFNANGADGARAAKLMNSFSVGSQVKQGMAKQRAYHLAGTPEIVVAGKYRISTALPGLKGKADGQELMLQIADYLIAKERAERG